MCEPSSCPNEIKKNDVQFEQAMKIVGEGMYLKYLAFVAGLATLSAISAMQSMFYILPAVGCEMNLSYDEKASLGSVTFIGSVFSSNLFGFLADQLGRRKVLLLSTFATCFFAALQCVSPNFITLWVSNFCSGLALGGVFGIPYVYLSEFCSSSSKYKYITMSSTVTVLANAYSPCVAWLVTWLDIYWPITDDYIFTSWRLYVFLNIIPMLLSALMIYNLPESPKYLLFQGHTSQALDIIEHVYKLNSKGPQEKFPVSSLCLDPDDEEVRQKKMNGKGGFCQFLVTLASQLKELFTPPLLIYTAYTSILMLAAVGLFGILQLWIPQEVSSMLHRLQDSGLPEMTLCSVMANANNSTMECHIDPETFMLSALIGVSFFIISFIMMFVVEVVEPKTILGWSIMLSSAICFLAVFSNTIFVTIASLGAVVAILCSLVSIIVGLIVHLFPTALRGTATTVSIMFGRLTVAGGNTLLAMAFKERCEMAYIAVATSLAVVGVITFLTPLEKNKKKIDSSQTQQASSETITNKYP